MTERFSINVDGVTHEIMAEPDMPLLYALRGELEKKAQNLDVVWRSAGLAPF